MKSIGWEEFFERLNMINFEKFDIIIAIGNGGIIPAAFIQQKLKIPMKIIWINYRDEDNKPKYEEPKLDFDIGFALKDKKLLLVDDVLRTGKR